MLEVEQVDRAKTRKVGRVIAWLGATHVVKTYKHLVIACDTDMRIWTETDVSRWFGKAAEHMADTGDSFEESLQATMPTSRADDEEGTDLGPSGEDMDSLPFDAVSSDVEEG